MPKPKILIVDDETSIRLALDRWFTLRGFEVQQAKDGQEAVEYCEKNQYDVIIMDLEMPRMTGLEAIVIIKKLRPEAPVLILSGFTKDADLAIANGAVKVLSKPLRLKELEKEVREILDHESSGDPLDSP